MNDETLTQRAAGINIFDRVMRAKEFVTPQKYEPQAMNFWLVERMRRAAGSALLAKVCRRRLNTPSS